MGWAEQEWATADLGDKRLNRRLMKVAQQLADKPSHSIPTACGPWVDTIAAYRLLSNDRFDWRAVPEPHVQATTPRMAAESVPLCLQDMTELDFNGQTTVGLGPLTCEAQRAYLHPTYAVSPQREPLRLLAAWMQSLGWPVDLLVRSQHNRIMPDGKPLWDQVQTTDSVGENSLQHGRAPGSMRPRGQAAHSHQAHEPRQGGSATLDDDLRDRQ